MDLRELKDEATACLSRGKFAKAATLYAKLAQLEPDNPQHLMKQGDALRRDGARDKAVEAYSVAAERLTKSGSVLKAIAAYKLVLEIDPGHEATKRHLEELSLQRFGAPTVIVAAPPRTQKIRTAPEALDPDEPAPPAHRQLPPLRRPVPKAAPEEESLELDNGQPPTVAFGGPRAEPLDPPMPPGAQEPSDESETDGPLELDLGEPPAPRQQQAAERARPAAIELDPMPLPVEPSAPREVTAITLEEQRIMASAAEVAHRELTPMGSVLTELVQDAEVVDASEIGLTPLPDADEPRPDEVKQERLPIFSDLPHEAFVEILNESFLRRFQADEEIVAEGEPGQSLFVLVRGSAKVLKRHGDEQVTLGKLQEGAFFGEMSLLNGEPRMASVIATEECDLIEISQMLLRQVASAYPAVSKTIVRFYKDRLLSNVLALSPLFRQLDPNDRPALLKKFVLKDMPAEFVVLKEGQKPDGLYVLMSGAALVTKVAEDQTVRPLALLREGDVFGEMSLLTRRPVTATVTTKRPTILLMLPKKDFDEVISVYPVVLEMVSELNDTRKAIDDQLLLGQDVPRPGSVVLV